MKHFCVALFACMLLVGSNVTLGQTRDNDEPSDNGKGVNYGKEIVEYWQVGVRIKAIGGVCSGFMCTIPIPNDWHDQEIKLEDEQLSPHIRAVKYRVMDHGVRQMVVSIPRVQPDAEAKALLTFEVRTKTILPPNDTTIFKKAKRVPREVKIHTNPSPYINNRSSNVRKKVKELVVDKENVWEEVKALYDFVHKDVGLTNTQKMVGSEATLREMKGIGEDKVNLFVALCRAHGIPCRIVWVRGHFYPEFFLHDDDDVGHWFPCEIVGTEDFGSYSKPRPILQRGDNIKVPEKKERQRFVAEFLKGKRSPGKPQVTFVRQKVAKPMPQ